MNRKVFHIHGDNIVECERVFSLIKTAYGASYKRSGPSGAVTSPRFILTNESSEHEFVFFPGFGRWEQDILKCITDIPGNLREAADAIITVVDSQQEKPLAAVEYCSALAAGNNAWQRCGRALSFARAGIPYFYLSDIGGFELDGNRNQKARRYPNIAVPFSYVALSLCSKAVALPVYELNPVADVHFKKHFSPALNDGVLGKVLLCLINGQPIEQFEALLEKKAISFINLIKTRPDRQKEVEEVFDAETAYSALKNGMLLGDFLKGGHSAPWSKSITIPITRTADKFLKLGSKYSRGITKSSLPISFISGENRAKWASEVSRLYPDIPKDISSWLNKRDDLVLCWIAGFKPRGDDSRPDRGLVPLARMLFGDSVDVLSFVYGPGKPDMWRLLASNPSALMKKNGLWESVLILSKAVILDSKTNKKFTKRGYTSSHWEHAAPFEISACLLTPEKPVSLNENDVDTAIHIIFSHIMAEVSFEGLCNPPGGDWSGVSILNSKRRTEYRWLTLPRVSGLNTKRPDHVFQFFPKEAAPFILTLESKETPTSVEDDIGPRLHRYLNNLFSSPPNASRSYPDGEWVIHAERLIEQSFSIVTGIAFLSDKDNAVFATLDRAEADVALALSFSADGNCCEIRGRARTQPGSSFLSLIEQSLTSGRSDFRFMQI